MYPDLNAERSLGPVEGVYRTPRWRANRRFFPVYLDNSATTAPLPEVVRSLTRHYSNPSSLYAGGYEAGRVLTEARRQLASLLGAQEGEILFTSGGTESNNWAIQGTLAALPQKRHIVTTAVEHSSVLQTCRRMEQRGFPLTVLPVDDEGQLDVEALAHAITDDTALVSIMAANNETGVLFPLQRIAGRVKEKGCLLHVDAVQAFGKMAIDLSQLPIDLMSLSGHKIHGPRGIGALFVRKGTPIEPLLIGGGQERGLRAGTENVAAANGLAIAATQAYRNLPADIERIKRMRDDLEEEILRRFPFARVCGDRTNRLPSTSCIAFAGWSNKAILAYLDQQGISLSGGSACCSRNPTPSHVLVAMGIAPAIAKGAIRVSLSRFTVEAEIRYLLDMITDFFIDSAAIDPLPLSSADPTVMASQRR